MALGQPSRGSSALLCLQGAVTTSLPTNPKGVTLTLVKAEEHLNTRTTNMMAKSSLDVTPEPGS